MRYRIEIVGALGLMALVLAQGSVYAQTRGCQLPPQFPCPDARIMEFKADVMSIKPGQRVIIVDDLLATGGTMQATVQLVRQMGGEIAGIGFAIELDFLKGRQKFQEYDVFSLLHYDE